MLSMLMYTDASRTKLIGTWWTTATILWRRFPTPSAFGWQSPTFCATSSSQHMAVGRFLLLARLSGTHCPMTFGIRNVQRTLSDSHWRHFCFLSINVSSALKVFFKECAISIHFRHWHARDWITDDCNKRQKAK